MLRDPELQQALRNEEQPENDKDLATEKKKKKKDIRKKRQM